MLSCSHIPLGLRINKEEYVDAICVATTYFWNTHQNNEVLLNAFGRKQRQIFTSFSVKLLSSDQEIQHSVTAIFNSTLLKAPNSKSYIVQVKLCLVNKKSLYVYLFLYLIQTSDK